jgi:hypothetical protein
LAVAKSYITEKEEQTLRMERESFYLGYKNKTNLKDELRKSKSYHQNQRTNYLTY